jgi:aminomethyltransferase
MTALSSEPPPRLTALYHEHIALGASMEERSGWLLPMSYGDNAGETAAIREYVGLLDIGDLGTIDLKAGNLDPFLTEALAIGSDEASILRLADDHSFILTSPEHRGVILERVRAATASQDCAHVVDVTGAFCGLRLLGPRAPAVLARLSSLDLAPDRFADGGCVQGPVARVHTVITRRDAAGIPGYDLFVDRDLGAYLWESLLDAGIPLGLRPVGRAVAEELR